MDHHRRYLAAMQRNDSKRDRDLTMRQRSRPVDRNRGDDPLAQGGEYLMDVMLYAAGPVAQRFRAGDRESEKVDDRTKDPPMSEAHRINREFDETTGDQLTLDSFARSRRMDWKLAPKARLKYEELLIEANAIAEERRAHLSASSNSDPNDRLARTRLYYQRRGEILDRLKQLKSEIDARAKLFNRYEIKRVKAAASSLYQDFAKAADAGLHPDRKEADQPMRLGAGDVAHAAVAAQERQYEQKQALEDKNVARVRGDTDGKRDARERFREVVRSAQAANDEADREEAGLRRTSRQPLLREWKRRGRSGKMHVVRRRQPLWR
jgi:hypothetical protein